MGVTFLRVQIIFEKTTQLLSEVYLIKNVAENGAHREFCLFGIVDLELGFLSCGTGFHIESFVYLVLLTSN
jgi:hypothetical protein